MAVNSYFRSKCALRCGSWGNKMGHALQNYLENAMKSWIYLFVAIIAEVIATSALKSSNGFSKLWPSLVVIAGYGTSFFFLSLTLRHIPVGVAYAIWSGVGVVLISTVGWLLFNQKLDAPAILGMGLIVSGVVVLNMFSKVASH